MCSPWPLEARCIAVDAVTDKPRLSRHRASVTLGGQTQPQHIVYIKVYSLIHQCFSCLSLVKGPEAVLILTLHSQSELSQCPRSNISFQGENIFFFIESVTVV